MFARISPLRWSTLTAFPASHTLQSSLLNQIYFPFPTIESLKFLEFFGDTTESNIKVKINGFFSFHWLGQFIIDDSQTVCLNQGSIKSFSFTRLSILFLSLVAFSYSLYVINLYRPIFLSKALDPKANEKQANYFCANAQERASISNPSQFKVKMGICCRLHNFLQSKLLILVWQKWLHLKSKCQIYFHYLSQLIILFGMFAKILLTFLAITSVCASFNYHVRKIYYTQQDNVCAAKPEYEESDKLDLVITFNDRLQIRTMIRGGTQCIPWYFYYYNKIDPSNVAQYCQCYIEHEPIYCDSIMFNQRSEVHKFHDLVMGITQTVTIQNPARFDQNIYQCQIKGDGNWQHFGPIGQIPAPRLEVYCERQTQQVKK